MVGFPPQSVAEATSVEPAANEEGDLPVLPVAARLAEPSRLAFDVSADLPFDLTLERLLAWNAWTPSLVPNALGRPGHTALCHVSQLRAPTPTETSLELPWKVQLSPHAGGGWAHRPTPATGPSGWTELWHTRLGVRDADAPGGVDERNAEDRVVRAVWARYGDFGQWIDATAPAPVLGSAGPGDPAGLAMDARSRYDIVRQSSDLGLYPNHRCRQPSVPNVREPVDVDLLMLTSLGGWLTAGATWRTGDEVSLESWQHRATLGRDHYVRLVRSGYLFPFGHRAAYVELSERKVLGGQVGTSRVAYLRKRYFLVVRQPERVYAGDPAMEYGGRGLPFTALRVLTETTPNLVAAGDPASVLPGVAAGVAFVPHVAGPGSPILRFELRGTDHSGRSVDFRAPAVFVFGQPPGLQVAADAVSDVIGAYAAATDVNTAAFGGRRTTVVPPADPADPASATVLVDSVRFAGGPAQGAVAAGDVPFVPKVERFTVDLPEARALVGSASRTYAFSYFDGYLANAFADNPGEVFLALPKDVAGSGLDLDPAKVGGLAAPDMAIGGLSRALGPLAGDLDDMARAARQEFDPTRIFDAGAKLLGDITLRDVLAPLTPNTPNLSQAVEIVTQDLGAGKLETRLRWRPKLKSVLILEVDPTSTLELRVRTVTQLGQPPSYEISGDLSNVTLTFFKGVADFIKVRVDTLRFTDASNAKPDVQCHIADVEFLGPLSFVKELAKLISFGKGNGVSVTPAPGRIVVALDLALPSLSVGILALENLAVHVGLALPFDGSPVVLQAALSSREHPFTVGVGIFRGGGFVGIALTARGLDMIEFSFEFGAGLSIDLGVASGSVEAMGGIYFRLSHPPGGAADAQTIELTAYLRLRGSLDVLGIITVSVELYLALGYRSPPEQLYGEATLTVSIDVFMFSMSVSVTCRRELTRGGAAVAGGVTGAGGVAGRRIAAAEAPVRFGDVYPRDAWARYCASFAALD